MHTALSYFLTIIPIAYTLIWVSATLLCLRFCLWPLSLHLATLVWAFSNAGRLHYWQQSKAQKIISHLLKEAPFAELLLSQRLGSQLHQQLKPGLPVLMINHLEQYYPLTWAVISPHWQAQLQQFSSNHLAQVMDDLLDELRGIDWHDWSLLQSNITSLTATQRLRNAYRLLAPLPSHLNRHMRLMTWLLLSVTVLFILLIPSSEQALMFYISAAWLVMTFYNVWEIRQSLGPQLWSSWSTILANDLSQQVYHLKPLFRTWQRSKANPLRRALNTALEYQWGSADFHASLSSQLMEQLIGMSQQVGFGNEQQVAVRNHVLQHFKQTSVMDQRVLANQITGNYWRILLAIVLVFAFLLAGITLLLSSLD